MHAMALVGSCNNNEITNTQNLTITVNVANTSLTFSTYKIRCRARCTWYTADTCRYTLRSRYLQVYAALSILAGIRCALDTCRIRCTLNTCKTHSQYLQGSTLYSARYLQVYAALSILAGIRCALDTCRIRCTLNTCRTHSQYLQGNTLYSARYLQV